MTSEVAVRTRGKAIIYSLQKELDSEE